MSLPFNLGVGGAMRAAYRFAYEEGYDCVVQVDADGQHDPADIARLHAALGDADVVVGARFAGVGDYVVRGPRRWAMRLLASTLSRLVGTPLTDPTSGFRMVNVHALSLFAFDFPEEYLGDTVEALVLASRAHLRIAQVPVAMRERTTGAPSQTPSGLRLPPARRDGDPARDRAAGPIVRPGSTAEAVALDGPPHDRHGRRGDAAFVLVFELLRRRRLRQKYAFLWVLVAGRPSRCPCSRRPQPRVSTSRHRGPEQPALPRLPSHPVRGVAAAVDRGRGAGRTVSPPG